MTPLKEQLIFEPQAQGAKIQSLVAQLAGEKLTYRSRVSRLTAQLRNATVEGQTDQMYAIAEVYQSDIQKIRPT